MLLNTLPACEPFNPVLRELFMSRLHLCLMQIEVIDRANACDQLAGKARADTVHQSPAHRAEMVLHFISSGDSVALSKLGELIFAADMLGGRLVDDEVRCEHGCCDFAAVRTVADEAVDEVWSFYRLQYVS